MAGELGNFPFTEIVTGEVSGSTTAKVLPTIVSAGLLHIIAAKDNAGTIYVGGAGVTVPDGTTDVTSGYPLAAGESMPPINIDTLNRLYFIGTAATDDLIYFIMR
jgi:hypothetical protein